MQFKALSLSRLKMARSRKQETERRTSDSPMQLERLERRELFSIASCPAIQPLEVDANAAIVARPAAVNSSLNGIYTGVAAVSAGKLQSNATTTLRVDTNATHISGRLVLNKFYSFQIDASCTFAKASKHAWAARVTGLIGDMTVQITDAGNITVSGVIFPPLLANFNFDFTGHKTANVSANPQRVAQPQAVSSNAMIASYSGTLETTGLTRTTYATDAVISQANGSKLKLITTITVPTFGALVGTFGFPSSLTNRFTLLIGESSSTGQKHSLTGKLDKRKNLQLTFNVPPEDGLTGSLTRE